MKTTVKLAATQSIVVQPIGQSIRVSLTMLGADLAARDLTLDQAEVLSMALLHAAQAITSPQKFPAVPAR